MNKDRHLVPVILEGSEKRKEKHAKADAIVEKIKDKLGEFVTRHGGWNETFGPVNLSTFPMFDGKEDTDHWLNSYDVRVIFTASRKDTRIPDGIKIEIHKDGENGSMKDFITISTVRSHGTDHYGGDGSLEQIFEIRDNLGRVVTGVKQLRIIDAFVDKICEYGDKHLPYPEGY